MLEVSRSPIREKYDARMREAHRQRLRAMTVDQKWQRYLEMHRLAQAVQRPALSDEVIAARRAQKVDRWLRIRHAFSALD